MKILDCTIRDGGYINRWNFEKKLVRELYSAISDSGIDIFEIGFLNQKDNINGIWKYCNDKNILEIINGISGAKIGVMIDFDKLHLENIPEKQNSPIDIIRVAVHKNKISESINLIEKIKDKGYIVSIQMMGYSTFTIDEKTKIYKLLENSNIDYAYIADSYGSIMPFQIKNIFEPLLKIPNIKIGFHSHNNLQMAFANTLEAIKCGVDIIDSSVFGMGRGAGNLPTEAIISYLQLKGNNKYNVVPILHCIDKYFIRLKRKYNWGYQLSYLLSGVFNCHPYYAKTLVDLREYTIDDIWKALEAVQELKPIGFSKKIVDNLINKGVIGNKKLNKQSDFDGEYKYISPEYINRHKNKDFLVLGNGPNLKKYKDDIEIFINKYNPIILGANFLNNLFIPDYHAFHNKRRLDYIKTVNNKSKLLIGQNIPNEMIKKYTKRKYEILSHKNLRDDFDIIDGVIQSNCGTVSILLLGVAIVMGSKRIFAAGLDGYINAKSHQEIYFYSEKDSPIDLNIFIKNHKICEFFLNQINKYLIKRNKEGIHILTSTTYKKFYKDVTNYI